MSRFCIPVHQVVLATVVTLLAGSAPAVHAQAAPMHVGQRWSGYVASNAYYTGVSAMIQAPLANSDPAQGLVASWVGVGGAGPMSLDLIQAGLEAATDGTHARYRAWWEALPGLAQEVDLAIGPGDWLLFDVHELGFDDWQITIVNGQQVFQKELAYASGHGSAEWIMEAPMLGLGQPAHMASVKDANFASMRAIANGTSTTAGQLAPELTAMLGPSGALEAIPSPLGPDGASFVVATTL